MSGTAFAQSITDAENLLAHFNALSTKPPPPQTEVLKRAGLVMAAQQPWYEAHADGARAIAP